MLKIKGNDRESCLQKQAIMNNGNNKLELKYNGEPGVYLNSQTTPHRAGPQMYYVAMMDCENNVTEALGENYGRIHLEVHLTDDF